MHILRRLSIIFVLLILIGLAYYKTTKITYSDYRPHISKIACMLGKQPQTDKPVIFIHGIKGSVLQKDDKTLWLSQRQVLTHTEPLIYNSTDTSVRATGILDRVILIPWLYEYRSYYAIARTLACIPRGYTFYYDWRQSPEENAKLLSSLVRHVKEKDGAKPSIVAHSMGGLITHYAMPTIHNDIDSIIYVGTPFQPGLSFLDDYRNGSETGLNTTIQNREAIFSAPSLPALLPHASEKKYYGKSLFDITTWTERTNTLMPQNINQDQFSLYLDNIRRFHTQIDIPRPYKNRFLFVIGNCQDTFEREDMTGRHYENGDGRVIASGALPYGYKLLNHKIIKSCAIHDQQLNTPDVLKEIFDFIEWDLRS